jgi:hypothetical protein
MFKNIFLIARTLLRRLTLLIPPIRAIVEQRDRHVQIAQNLTIKDELLEKENVALAYKLQLLTAQYQSLLGRNLECNGMIERLTAESSVLHKTNRDLISNTEALHAENGKLRIELEGLIVTARDQIATIESLSLRNYALLKSLPIDRTGLLKNPNEKVVLLHIPKTAGTTLSHLLYKAFLPGEVLTDFSSCGADALGHYLSKDIEQLVSNLSQEQFNKCKVLSGHLSVGFDCSLDFKARYVSFVRNPIDRLLSGFLYGTKGMVNLSQDYILFGLHRSISVGSSPGFDNPLTRTLSGNEILTIGSPETSGDGISTVTMSDRRAAIRLLRSEFGFVGITERFYDSCKLLFLLLGKKQPSEQLRLNETNVQISASDLPVSTLRALERHHLHDIAVYAVACEIFNEHARSHNMELARPYTRQTFGGAFSSGDYAHIVSCDDAFSEMPSGVWLSFPGHRKLNEEFIGFEFETPYNCTAIEIQIASLSDDHEISFTVEASDDYFSRDIRSVAQISVPANHQRHVIKLTEHSVKAKYWRLLHRCSNDNTPLAIAFVSFSPAGSSPARNMAMVLRKLDTVRRKYNEEIYVSLLNDKSQNSAA